MRPRPLLCSLSTLFLVLSSNGASASKPPSPSNKRLVHPQVQGILEHVPAKQVACNAKPTGPIETTECDYETVESVNEELYTHLHELVTTPFFKYFKLDLYRECPFWKENGFCMHRECAVTTIDESQVPEKWRAAALSQVQTTSEEQRKSFPGCYYRDSDFCFFDDDGNTDGEYLDLTLNPEVFTGYAGPSAHRVWSSIYEENCFGISESTLTGSPSTQQTSARPLGLSSMDAFKAESADAECLEKRVYYRIISGLHASISTHVCYENLNQTTGEWGPNLECFIDRVAAHPERLQYIYFNSVLLLRALARVEPWLAAYDLCAFDGEQEKTKEILGNVLNIAKKTGKFDETLLFQGENAQILKEEFKDHFRNVSRIMDCVGCDKCRLWGKVQVTGVASALKILFELDEKNLDPKKNPNLLQRAEIVALINTLHRFSESLHAVDVFRGMWAKDEDPTTILESVVAEQTKQAASQPLSSSSPPRPGQSVPIEPFHQQVQKRVTRLLSACRENTEYCVHLWLQQLSQFLSAFVSALRSLFGGNGRRSDL
ncbi:hypothetical protein BOTBODRAFT_50204 [Botryobasidium botryosum FD-172 SS1]|uniref:Endoplasmic oxidoreductin n=1 Tax=Botryobasidium botryosum (strain FD-172 SS1) TaxID=930990 RepID=A0A067N0R5_BOTB1|nr:hypothetical protein BOTBODRAFT_50204 [Botryobasidium botryosum FD-172 SS1]